MKIVTKPLVKEAIQVRIGNLNAVRDFMGGEKHRNIEFSINYVQHKVFIHTLEGSMRADVGDWIIKGIQGEFYPCKADIFEATYTKVDEDKELIPEVMHTDPNKRAEFIKWCEANDIDLFEDEMAWEKWHDAAKKESQT